jgi:hypothetical protein
MPSAPGYPAERQSAQRPAPNRVAETFDNIESFRAILLATTAFQEVASFSGTADSVHINTIGGPVDVRVRFRGEAAGGFVQIPANGNIELKARAQFVEARDPGGAGAQAVITTGRYVSRGIDVRQNRPGPSRELPFIEEGRRGTQVQTGE